MLVLPFLGHLIPCGRILHCRLMYRMCPATQFAEDRAMVVILPISDLHWKQSNECGGWKIHCVFCLTAVICFGSWELIESYLHL